MSDLSKTAEILRKAAAELDGFATARGQMGSPSTSSATTNQTGIASRSVQEVRRLFSPYHQSGRAGRRNFAGVQMSKQAKWSHRFLCVSTPDQVTIIVVTSWLCLFVSGSKIILKQLSYSYYEFQSKTWTALTKNQTPLSTLCSLSIPDPIQLHICISTALQTHLITPVHTAPQFTTQLHLLTDLDGLMVSMSAIQSRGCGPASH